MVDHVSSLVWKHYLQLYLYGTSILDFSCFIYSNAYAIPIRWFVIIVITILHSALTYIYCFNDNIIWQIMELPFLNHTSMMHM